MSFSEPIRPLQESDVFDENKDYYVPFSVKSLQKLEFNSYQIITITLFGKDYYVCGGSEVIGNLDGNPLVLNFCMDLYNYFGNETRYSSNNCTLYFYIDPNPGNFETASLQVFSKELNRFHDIDIHINKYDLFCKA